MAQEFTNNWKLSFESNSANLENWGKGVDDWQYVSSTNSPVARWIAEFAGRLDIASPYYDRENCPDEYSGTITYHELAQALNCFDPIISRVAGADKISIYESAIKRRESRRLALNPGKAIRRIIPGIPDQWLDRTVTEFKLKFDSNNYRIVWAESRDEFRASYNSLNFDRLENINTTSTRKSLIASCMTQGNNTITGDKYQGAWNDSNPGEAYASPDFRVVLAYNAQSGKIAARCIVRVDVTPFCHAPIYGTSENTIDLIQAELDSKSARPAKLRNYDEGDRHATFAGARLLVIPVKGGILAPYQDCIPGYVDRPDSDDEYMTLSSDGFQLAGLSGVMPHSELACDDDDDDDDSVICESCSCRIDSLESYDHDGDSYCSNCYSETFGTCESCDDTIERDELTTVYSWNAYRSRSDSQCVCDSCRRHNYTEIDAGRDSGEYWADDSSYELAYGNHISARDYFDGNYFTSDNDGQIYPCDEMIETDDGESWAECEAIDAGLVRLDSGTWGKPDLERISLALHDKAGRQERQAEREAMDSGQYALLLELPRAYAVDSDCNQFGETVTNSGLTYWAGIEARTLAEFPAIGKLQRECGNAFYFWSRYDSRIRAKQYFEFSTLAECVFAFTNQSN